MQEYIPILVPSAMMLLVVTIIAAYGFRWKRRPKPWCKLCNREMVIRNWDGASLDLVCISCGRRVTYIRER